MDTMAKEVLPKIQSDEKMKLYQLFFSKIEQQNAAPLIDNIPPLVFTPFRNEDPFFSIFPHQLNENMHPVNSNKNVTLAPLKTDSVQHSKDKDNVELVCPHKNMKHYAKVNYLNRICASTVTISMVVTRELGCAHIPTDPIMLTASARIAISATTTRYENKQQRKMKKTMKKGFELPNMSTSTL
jgi:hypothetical protein